SLTALLVYLAIVVLVPPAYAWLAHTIPGVGYFIVIIFLVGVYHIASRSFHKRPLAELGALPPELPEIQAYYPELKEEQEIVGKYLNGVTKRAQKDVKTIVVELTYIYHVLSKFGDTP